MFRYKQLAKDHWFEITATVLLTLLVIVWTPLVVLYLSVLPVLEKL